MIILSDGSKWVIDSSEWKDAGIPYEDAKKCKIPLTSKREFVRMLVEPSSGFLPRKWTPETNGYWDCHFDVSEVLEDIATRKVVTPWSRVYEMPWKEVIVMFEEADSGGYDVRTSVVAYLNYAEYLKAVAFGKGEQHE